MKTANSDIDVIALCKGSERYVFLWSDGHRRDLFGTFRRFAVNPELSFSEEDEAALIEKVRRGQARAEP